MRHLRSGFPFLVLSLLLPAAAGAQNEIGVSFGGGITLSRGDVSETHGRGINLGAKTTVPLSERLTVLASIGYSEVRLEQDGAARRFGRLVRCPNVGVVPEQQVEPCEPSTFRSGGGFIEGGDRRVLGVLLEAQLHLLPSSGRFSPYVLAGVGVSQHRVPDMDLYFVENWHTVPGRSEVAPTADAGAGLQVRVSPAVALFAQATYLAVFADETTAMMPIHAGLLIEMGP